MSDHESDITASVEAEEARLRERRHRDKLRKRRDRQRDNERRAKVADQRGSVQVGPVPVGLAATRAWVRQQHDLYSDRKITSQELGEVRRTAATIADLYRAQSDRQKSQAAMIAAQATAEISRVLATLEHGAQAVVMLEKLQASVSDGAPRRPLPRPRAITIAPEGDAAS